MKKVFNFLCEAGLLKRVKRTGWWVAQVKDTESVAEHSLRTAQVAYLLAAMEGANPERAAALVLFHDMHEARINDAHAITKKYIDHKGAEEKAARDQVKALPENLQAPLGSLVEEWLACETAEARIAKDADRIEGALQAKEYLEQGYKVQEFIDNAKKGIKTHSARKLLNEIDSGDTNAWWHEMKY